MRVRHVSVLIALAIAVAAVLAAAIAAPAEASPSKTTVCTSCHSGAASGTVTATPSTSTPAAGATYTVAITIGLTSSGSTGYHIASTDAAGTATTWTAVYSAIGAQTSWTATMTAPATAGTYYYKVWCAKGPNNATGMAKAALYSITVPAPTPTAAITSLTPTHAQTGASVVIAGTNLGSGGTVRFGTTAATTTAWSATSVTATVPASLAAGATTVTVTPAGGAASNAVAFTVDAPPAPTAALTSLSPTSGPVGATLTITGTNLGASGAVTVGGVTAATTAWSATSITCTVPAGLTVGSRSVIVTPTGGAASNALLFSVTLPPAPTAAITSLTPTHAQTGASVVIAGTNLGSGGTVRFGTTAATTTAWSATSVTATVPASLAAGATTVTVTPAGGAASNAVAFTVDAPAPGDTTPPVTVASGVSADGWCNGAMVVTLTATDEAGGSGVASVTYQVDDLAPVTVDGGHATADLDAIYSGDASGVQGTHTIAYYATDVAGNVEPSQTLTLHHDSSRPTTRAPRAAAVRRQHTAALKYEVRDATPNAGTATVVIVIKNRHGKVVKRLHLGTQPVNTALTARFTCTLRAGAYRFSVRATDAAGNTQSVVASQRLTVWPAIGS